MLFGQELSVWEVSVNKKLLLCSVRSPHRVLESTNLSGLFRIFGEKIVHIVWFERAKKTNCTKSGLSIVVLSDFLCENCYL